MAESLMEALEAAESERRAHTGSQAAGPQALTVSADDFSALEERVLRAVALVRRERQARLAAEESSAQAEARVAQAEARLTEQSPRLEQLEGEVAALKAERDTVRQRVERLLSQLDALEI